MRGNGNGYEHMRFRIETEPRVCAWARLGARMCASACNAYKRKLDMFRVVVPRVRMRIMHGRIMRVGASVRAVSVKTRAG